MHVFLKQETISLPRRTDFATGRRAAAGTL